MKNLIVYFSLDGDTKFIADCIKEVIDCDILELAPKKKYSTGNFGKYFWGGRSVLLRQKPELINNDIDLKNYKNIIIGTPIWCGTYAPPFNTFIMNNEIKYKNIALFACHGGGGAEKCFSKFRDELKDNNFIGEISFVEPLKRDKDNCMKKVQEWAKKLHL
ncbi:MAG: flavodoxin [Clostridium sp.]|nr:flavodoxin [Clostridium sp.]